jgi:6-pyruvoyltetrahydropterin/6-carboxytetrahydropterin synthase
MLGDVNDVRGSMKTYLESTFEAAHRVPGFSNLHGHTFVIRLTFEGPMDPKFGWVADLYAVKRIVETVKEKIGRGDSHGDGLGEGNIDDIAEIRVASLENIAMWFWDNIAPHHPTLSVVDLNRGFRGSIEGCEYRGPSGGVSGRA